MNFAILRRPRTQALLDGDVTLPELSARWLAMSDPLGWSLPPHEHHRDLASGDLDGGEMSISSFVQAKSRGAPLVALPIFLKRGLIQRSLFCSLDSALSSPAELVGKKVGLVSHHSSMAVWMRGILNDGYGLPSSNVQWFSLSGSTHDCRSLSIPGDFAAPRIKAWEELDGYPHDLDRRETFLLSMLDHGTLDAVVSFQAQIDWPRSRPLLNENSLWSQRFNSPLYPINHLFVVKIAVVNEFPTIAESLMSAFRAARSLWTNYQPRSERQAIERETAKLGFDPFACRLGAIEKTTLETFVGYLHRENFTSRRLGLDELFHADW